LTLRRPDCEDLSGTWRFRPDPEMAGIERQYFAGTLGDDCIDLPGTTETRGKGDSNDEALTWALTRIRKFTGFAWYQRDITIAEDKADRWVRLVLERSKRCRVWLDDRFIGERDTLCTAQVYDLGRLAPGRYRLTILVDNHHLPPLGGTHQLSEHTQTNWNGILGKMELQFLPLVHITHVDIAADTARRKVRATVEIRNTLGRAVRGRVTLQARSANTSVIHETKAQSYDVALTAEINTVTLEHEMGDGVLFWDEYNPAVYSLRLALECEADGGNWRDEAETAFGFRDFAARGSRFAVNGRTVFLRGKVDCCVFPLTGHPPFTVEEWRTVFNKAKSYGINHYRFHSWCPPEAAFTAADLEGMYLQVELPVWANLHEAGEAGHEPELEPYLREEGVRILREFGNHPSFVLFSLGNELGGNPAVHARLLALLREADRRRRLYAQGANNFLWEPFLAEGDDFWVTMRTGGPGRMVRGSYAHCDLPLGHVQTEPPSTMTDYGDRIADVPVPVISHEVGQYQVFPNFGEIGKYTGVLRPKNLETFRKRLEDAGMLHLADRFFQASGRLAVLNYREDIEAALRTGGLGGFQLLDLQDFPGQGTALVGILDAFMDSKGLIDPEKWREFCSDTVLLARFGSYTYREAETFDCRVDAAHYGPADLPHAVLHWSVSDMSGGLLAEGEAEAVTVRQGGLTRLGHFRVPLARVGGARELVVTLRLKNTAIRTQYRIWVYPDLPADPDPGAVAICRDVREAAERLERGEAVLFIPDVERLAAGVDGMFASDFWCYPTFEAVCKHQNVPPAPGTLGIVCDPSHPALRGFPTQFHSDYQWWHIVTRSKAAILDFMPADFVPIVQVIDNFARNHRLGLLFEAKVHEGRLLACGSDLLALRDRPEARQLLHSLLRYMNSDAFRPRHRLDPAKLAELFATRDDGGSFPGRPETGPAAANSANILDFAGTKESE